MNKARHWLSGTSSEQEWATRVALFNILTVFLTTIVVAGLLEVDRWMTRLVLVMIAGLIIWVSARLLGRATSVREARFPQYSETVLAMTRVISTAVREEAGTDFVSKSQAAREAFVRDLSALLTAFEDLLAETWSKECFGGQSAVEAVIMHRAVDSYVTVGVWAKTRPLSLDSRSDDLTFYEKTEAAELYREYVDRRVRAPIHIVPDVSQRENYDHFERPLSMRTKSTILFPIYGDNAKMYGFVAIVARERSGLFREEDLDFWTEAWSLWEPQFLRHIRRYEATGRPFASIGE